MGQVGRMDPRFSVGQGRAGEARALLSMCTPGPKVS